MSLRLSPSDNRTTTSCGRAIIARARVRPTRIERTPASLPDGTVRVDLDGWIFPRSGVAFVWTLQSEAARSREQGRTSRGRTAA